MKKLSACMIVFALVFSLAACQGKPQGANPSGAASPDKPVTLSLWHQWGSGHEADVLQETLGRFTAENSDIRIEAACVTDYSKILTAISSGNPPDVLSLWDTAVVGQWAAQGALTQLDSYLERDQIDRGKFIPGAFDMVSFEGKVYGLPFVVFNSALLYNVKLFEEAGLDPNNPPKTFDELLADSQALTKVNDAGEITQLGFIPAWPGTNLQKIVGYMFGGSFYDAQAGKITANNSGILDAIAFEKKFYSLPGINPQAVQNFIVSAGQYLTAQDLLESQKVAMAIDGPWALKFAAENAPEADAQIRVAYPPTASGHTELYGTSNLDCNPQIIPAGSKHPEEAWRFISWEATNPDVTKTFSELAANLPQLKDVRLDSVEEDPRLQLFVELAANGKAKVFPKLAKGSEYSTNLADIESKALLDPNYDFASALDSLNTSLNQ